MLDRQGESEKLKGVPDAQKKGPIPFALACIDRGVQIAKNTWADAYDVAECTSMEYPRFYVAIPFILTLVSAPYTLAAGAMTAGVLELEYKSNCYYSPPEETNYPITCKIGKWFGAPDYEDYQRAWKLAYEEEVKTNLLNAQQDCRDALGSWVTGSRQTGDFVRIECEDEDNDGIPDAVHYTGPGEDISYSLKTGQRI